MKDKTRNLVLGIALVAIVASILWLQQPGPVARQGKGNAPELQSISGYINTDGKNITIGDYIGKKVILIDFWTYTCINCQRTLPYLTMWDAKYRDKGLLIVGVHSPEFDFEKKKGNVERAVEKWGIKYPVVQDNDMATWRVFGNRYWPHKYLIDIEGNIVYDHIGEGGYEETEKRIQGELEKRMQALGSQDGVGKSVEQPSAVVAVDFGKIRTPEIYFGYALYRGNVGNLQEKAEEKSLYAVPAILEDNTAYLGGDWVMHGDNAELVSDTGKVALSYDAKVVNIVASGPSEAMLLLDGKNPGASRGFSVDEQGKGHVEAEDLYELVNAPDYGRHVLEIQATKGFKIFTFTFG